MRIILDAGHGGLLEGVYQTAGKRSLTEIDGSWYYEGVGNRNIVNEIAACLRINEYEVKFTVDPTDPTDISLKDRVQRINQLAKEKESILISVHSNGHSNTSANGHEVFTCNGSSKNSELLANIWLEEYFKLVKDQRNRGHKKANFYVIKRSSCPAILIETAFHTNPEEVRLLRHWEYKINVALAVLNTIRRYETRKTW
jgi:N-acetylmuramoyl-L-alanine amidase